MSGTMVVFLYGSVFLFACTLILFFCWIAGAEQRELERRLGFAAQESGDRTDLVPGIVKDEGLSDIPFLYRMLKQSDYSRNLRRLLDSANLSMTVGHLILLVLVSAAIGLVLTLRLQSFLVSLLALFAFGSIPILGVMRIRKKRLTQFESTFPEVLDMIRNAIRSGFTIVRAIQLVGTEGPEPARTEFLKTSEEIKLGMPFKDALMHMVGRIDSIDLKLFVTAVLIQRESGGNLNEVLKNIGMTIRARFKLAGQMRIYTAQGRLTQFILGALPFGFILIMLVVKSDYIGVLFQDPAGHVILCIAAMLQVMGFLVIRKIMKIRIQ